MKSISQTKKLLGAYITITLPEKDSKHFNKCFRIIKEFGYKYSRFKENSEIAKLNNNLYKWNKISDELINIITLSEHIKKDTAGYFDITIKSTLDILGYDKEKPNTEKNKIIMTNNKLKNYISKILLKKKDVIINKKEKKIYMKKEIDIGGIGKGYIGDKIKKYLLNNNIKDFTIDMGGDIYISGKQKIFLKDPENDKKIIGEIYVNKSALASSSPHIKKWSNSHHLINPKTSLPETTIKQIFVLHKDLRKADAYATGLLASGFENAKKIAKKINIPIVIISNHNRVFYNNEKIKIYHK